MMKDPTLSGTKLDRYFHVCAFFHSRDEEYEILSPFYKEAVDWGEKMMHIIDPKLGNEHTERMMSKGIQVPECSACGQLQVVSWQDAYLTDGRFDPEKMLSKVQQVLDAGKAAGFPRMRIMGNMVWAVHGNDIHPNLLIEYESLVNDVLTRNRQPAVCVYDINKLSASLMMDILRTHPLTLIGGVVHQNPFYTPPEELIPILRERAERRAYH